MKDAVEESPSVLYVSPIANHVRHILNKSESRQDSITIQDQKKGYIIQIQKLDSTPNSKREHPSPTFPESIT